MKLYILAALLAVCYAAEQAPGPTREDQAPGPDGEATIAKLARQQHGLNRQALHYGAGVGTAPYYGVPGTDLKGVHNDGRYYGNGYGHNGAYGYGGYAHGYNGHNGGYYGGNHGGYYAGY